MNGLRNLGGKNPWLVSETVESLIHVVVLKRDGPVFAIRVLKRLQFDRARVYVPLFTLILEILNSV